MMKARGYGWLMRINGPVTVPAKLTIVCLTISAGLGQLMEVNLVDNANPLDRDYGA